MKKVDLSLVLVLITVAAPLVLGQTASSPSSSPSSQTGTAASQSPVAVQSPNREKPPAGEPAAPQSTNPNSGASASTGTGNTNSSAGSPMGENPASASQNPGTAANETNMAGQGPVTPQSTVPPTNQAGNSVTTGVGLNDAATLQSQIQNAIQNEPTLKNDNINVSVNDSTIELSGNAQTGKEKETAYRIASSFAENRRVRDRITVSGRGTALNQSDRESHQSE